MCLIMAAVASLAVTTQAWNLGFLQSTKAPTLANASGLPSSNNTAPKKTKPSFLQVLSSSGSTSGSEEAEVVSDAAADAVLKDAGDEESAVKESRHLFEDYHGEAFLQGSEEAEVVGDAAADAVLKDADHTEESVSDAADDEHEYEEAGTESNEVAVEDPNEADKDSLDADDDDDEGEEESAYKESRHLFEDYHGEAFLQDEDSDHEESSDSEDEADDEDDEEVEIADPHSESDIDEMDGHEDSFTEIDEGDVGIDDSEAEEDSEDEDEDYRLEA